MMDVYWLEQTEAEVPSESDWLSASEATRLDGMRFAKRHADWRLGRWTGKRALAIYWKLPSHPRILTDIEVRPAASGAPEVFVANKPAADYHFAQPPRRCCYMCHRAVECGTGLRLGTDRDA